MSACQSMMRLSQSMSLVGDVVLVRPVRGDAPLGTLVHLDGPDLHLDDLAAGTDDRRVQALVEVELRHRDVVLEPADHRLVTAVDATERGVAILHRFDDHADRDEVEDVVELLALLHHLLVDAPQVLAATRDLRLDVEIVQTAADFGDRLGEVDLALRRARADEVVELGETLWVQRRERQVFELLLELLHAQAMGKRCVDVERLLGDASLLVAGHRGDGAHVVQAVGELDDQHAQVACHRHQHLAHRRGLLRFFGIELQPLELGDAVDDGGHLGTERGLDIGDRDLGVFDRVVQQGRGQRDLVEADVGHDPGHGQADG